MHTNAAEIPKTFTLFGMRTSNLRAGLLVAIVAVLVYANSLGSGFVWDDHNVIVNNPALRDSPLAVFSSIDATRDYELLPYYRPLTVLTFLLEERVHGLLPFPMHLVNILLHAANTFLVFLLARTLVDKTEAAFLAALLFAVHPINTEAVNFISGGRNTMLACLCILTAYLLHRRCVRQEKVSGTIAAALFLLAGVLSKETALFSLPFILALEVPSLKSRTPGVRIQAFLRLLPYAAAVSCYLVMRWFALSRLGIQTGIVPGLGAQQLLSTYRFADMWSRLADNAYMIPRYFLNVIWPAALSPRYITPDHLPSVAMQLTAGWICVFAAIGWLLSSGRSTSALFGLSWLAVFYLPVSGIVPLPSAPMADRYFYVPAIGLWIIMADQVMRLPFARARVGIVAAALVLLALGGLTIGRNLDWKSDRALFTRFVEQYPDNAYAHAGLGEAYLASSRQDEGELAHAERALLRAQDLNPLIPGVHTNLGYIRLARGDSDGAVKYYTTALGIHPSDKAARLNRGIALENLGRNKEARNDFMLFLNTPGHEMADARPYAESRVRELSQ